MACMIAYFVRIYWYGALLIHLRQINRFQHCIALPRDTATNLYLVIIGPNSEI